MSVAGSAAIDHAKGIPSAATAQTVSIAARLRRRRKVARSARERRTALETDLLDTPWLLPWLKLQLQRREQMSHRRDTSRQTAVGFKAALVGASFWGRRPKPIAMGNGVNDR
jgi:hypothetical protein